MLYILCTVTHFHSLAFLSSLLPCFFNVLQLSPEPRNAPALRDVPGEELDFRNEALNALRMEELLKESLGESSLEKKLSWKRETGGKNM